MLLKHCEQEWVKLSQAYIINSPLNLNPVDNLRHARIHGLTTEFSQYGFLKGKFFGAPTWAKASAISLGAGAIAGGSGNDCNKCKN